MNSVVHAPMATKTLRLRIKDRHREWLCERARDVNMVWNYVNDLSQQVWRRERRFLTGFDFWPYLKGVTKAGLDLPVQTVQEVAEQYAAKRSKARKVRLSWRASRGARRSLGWLPFKVRTVTYRGGQIRYAGKWLGLWDSYDLSQYELRAGSLSVSNRGSHLAALRIASEHGVHLRRKWTPWKVQEGGHGDITARR